MSVPATPEIDTSDLKALRRSLEAMLLFIKALMVIERLFGGLPDWLRKITAALLPDIDTLEDAVYDTLLPQGSDAETSAVDAQNGLTPEASTSNSLPDQPDVNGDSDPIRGTARCDSGSRRSRGRAGHEAREAATLPLTEASNSKSRRDRPDENPDPERVQSTTANDARAAAPQKRAAPTAKITPRARPPPRNPNSRSSPLQPSAGAAARAGALTLS